MSKRIVISHIIFDTLTNKGEWSMKRLSAFVSFWLAAIYEMVLGTICGLPTHQYVFEAFILYAGYIITGTIVDKKLINKNVAGSTEIIEETTKSSKTKIQSPDAAG